MSKAKPIPELLEYLAALPNVESREAFAARCGTSLAFLKQVAYGHKPAGESLAINVDRESVGFVVCERLRPDVDFPYLRGTAKKAAQRPAARR